jgi:hypothetical protein
MARRSAGAAESAAAAATEAAQASQARQSEGVSELQETSRSLPKNEAPADAPPLRRGNPNRENVLADIRRSRGETVETPEPAKVEKPEAPQVAKEEPTETVATETPVEVNAETPALVKVKVDGEEFEVPQADVDEAGGVTAFQKQRAADNRLKKAQEALSEAKAREAAILALAQRQQAPAAPQAHQVSATEFIQQKMDSIRFGTPEEGAAAMQEILSQNRVDPNAVTAQAISAMMHHTAVNQFDRDYADVMKLPLGPDLVVALRTKRIQEAQAQGRQIADWNEFYSTIGKEVRNALGKSSQLPGITQNAATTAASPTGNPSTVSDKVSKKETIVNPQTAAARAVLPTEDTKPETRAEQLSRMRKARGLPVG